MFRSFYCAIGAAIAVFAANGASAQISNPQQFHETVKVTTIVAHLIELGVATELSVLEDGSFLVAAPASGGNVMLIALDSCAGPFSKGCSDMTLLVTSPTVELPYADTAQNLSAVNFLNDAIPLGKMVLSEGIPIAVRYEHFSYGITKGNLINDIVLAALAAENAFKYLQEAGTAASTGMQGPGAQGSDALAPDNKAFRLSRPDALPTSHIFASRALRAYLRSGQFRQSSVLIADTAKGSRTISADLLKQGLSSDHR